MADAETVVWEYLQTHETINNSIARSLTGITDANKMKQVFNRLKKQNKIQIVDGTRSSATLWQKKAGNTPKASDEQLSFEF